MPAGQKQQIIMGKSGSPASECEREREEWWSVHRKMFQFKSGWYISHPLQFSCWMCVLQWVLFLLAIWHVLYHLNWIYWKETVDTLSQCCWNVTCRLTFDLTVVCHFQDRTISFTSRVSLQVIVWLRPGYVRTLVKQQWCSRVMMVMETAVISIIVNEVKQSWITFCALFYNGLFFKHWFCSSFKF